MIDLFDWFNFYSPAYYFSRTLKDMLPTDIKEKDGKVEIVANALGIAEKDIDISVENSKWSGWKYVLWVRGTTHNEYLDKDFSINLPFVSNNSIKTVDWKLNNGIIHLELGFDEPVKPTVKINKI
jgi:HSP20 family molecular chaperone IbpA